MFEDIANTFVLVIGILVFAISTYAFVKHFKWARSRPTSMVVCAYLIDDFVDTGVTSVFVANAWTRSVCMDIVGGEVNAISPAVSLVLRLAIYLSSAVAALYACDRRLLEEESCEATDDLATRSQE